MMVIQQTVAETTAAITSNRYTYDLTAGQNTYRLNNFASATAGTTSTALTDTVAENIRRILSEETAIPSAATRLVLTGGGTQVLTGSQAGNAVNFNGDGTFSLTGVNLSSRVSVTIDFGIPEHVAVQHVMYPADRCTWTQEPSRDRRGYAIRDAAFYPGNAAQIALGSISAANEEVLNVELGFIGKSGRFVGITDAN